MYCKKCGTQNTSDAKFCAGCGEALDSQNNGVNTNMLDTSIIRKAIKAKAKNSSKSSLVITFVLVILLAILGIFVMAMNVGLGAIYYLLYMILWLFVFFGIVKSSLEISRGQQVECADVIKGSFKNPSWCLKYILGSILFGLLIGLLMLIPILGFILGLIAEIYLIPVLVIYMYKLADPNVQDKSISSLVKSSLELAKGHRVEFYGLLISFFGWFLLSMVTFGIALLWVIPYINVALANFYRYLNNEEEYNSAEKGISNAAIIAIGIIGYFAFIVIIVILVVALIMVGIVNSDDFEKNSDGTYEWHWDNISRENDRGSFYIENMEGVNVAIPNGYETFSVSGFDEAFMKKDGTVLIATKVIDDAGGLDLDVYSEELKKSLPSTYTCEDIENKTIHGNAWNKLTCEYSEGTILHNYIAIDSDKAYLVTVTAYDTNLDEGNRVTRDVEHNLSFAN